MIDVLYAFLREIVIVNNISISNTYLMKKCMVYDVHCTDFILR
jgi:hypothetical protein